MQGQIEHLIGDEGRGMYLRASKQHGGIKWIVRMDTPHEGLTVDLDAPQLMELARLCVQLANLSGVTRRLR